jgi:hypothetical protein
MGTNYYLERDICPHCKRSDERLHIGKSSAGWCFALHIDAEEGINSLDDWKALWSAPDARIVDEYGRETSPEEMLEKITERAWPQRDRERSHQFYADNHAEPGPNNLIRHAIGRHCVGHGDGTWDLVPGEFS